MASQLAPETMHPQYGLSREVSEKGTLNIWAVCPDLRKMRRCVTPGLHEGFVTQLIPNGRAMLHDPR